ncbi:MAG TPA: MGMT family protein [Gemmatimonadales bacterium]|nr:MGMT family protein [Gemmatimonadales bacterium]
MNPFYHRIYRVVRHIPKGRVATYGVVARLAGRPGAARQVGWALSALPDDGDVPWWRVINAAGRISLSTADHGAVVQRALLLREGVKFAPGGAVNLALFGWPSEAYDSVAAHTRAASSRRSRRLKGLRT